MWYFGYTTNGLESKVPLDDCGDEIEEKPSALPLKTKFISWRNRQFDSSTNRLHSNLILVFINTVQGKVSFSGPIIICSREWAWHFRCTCALPLCISLQTQILVHAKSTLNKDVNPHITLSKNSWNAQKDMSVHVVVWLDGKPQDPQLLIWRLCCLMSSHLILPPPLLTTTSLPQSITATSSCKIHVFLSFNYTGVPLMGIPLDFALISCSFCSFNFLSSSSDGNRGGRSFPINSTMPILAMSLFRGGIWYTLV